jgi:uncharacterized protein YecE (DUF72 family)
MGHENSRGRSRRVWAYFNNDRNEHAVKNARMFLRLLRASQAALCCAKRGARNAREAKVPKSLSQKPV